MTQFGRALAELNIEIMCANSSQAKGRVERANRTLQDRLVKELRLAGACDMESANALLPDFLVRFNKRFAIPAASAENLHRKLNVPSSRLNDILCHREQRYVGAQLTFHYGAGKSFWNEASCRRSWPASTWKCTIQIGRSKCDGRVIRFPTAYSIKSGG